MGFRGGYKVQTVNRRRRRKAKRLRFRLVSPPQAVQLQGWARHPVRRNRKRSALRHSAEKAGTNPFDVRADLAAQDGLGTRGQVLILFT